MTKIDIISGFLYGVLRTALIRIRKEVPVISRKGYGKKATEIFIGIVC